MDLSAHGLVECRNVRTKSGVGGRRVIPTGTRYGRLVVLGVGRLPDSVRVYAVCRCDCGPREFRVRTDGLVSGDTQSCGCRQGDAVRTHGCWKSPLYDKWRNMMKRCYDPTSARWLRYGGRGIRVCPRWQSVDAFVADLEPGFVAGLELDRIDYDGDYEPGNVRWATHADQARNRSSVHRIEIGGRTMTAKEWAVEKGMRHNTILDRIKRGWDPVKAVTTPGRRLTPR